MATMKPSNFLTALSALPISSIGVFACRRPPSVLQQTWQQQCSRYSTPAASTTFVTYRLAAAYVGKSWVFDSKQDILKFHPGTPPVSKLRAPYRRPKSGQDAFFISRVNETDSYAFGVADGVGGWADSGVDPSDFSHGLCEYMADHAYNMPPDKELKARGLLQVGVQRVMADESIAAGGSTAIVAIGKADGTLEVANLGDSGFIQLRPNAVHHVSPVQTHAFNTPYQLSKVPAQVLARSRLFGGMPLMNHPKDAAVSYHEVRHGDVLVFATDGVWDNLGPAEVLRSVSQVMMAFKGWDVTSDGGVQGTKHLKNLTVEGGLGEMDESTMQTLIAVTIAGEAKAAGLNTQVDGPFAKSVKKHFPGEDYRGGKPDDVAVVVAIVVSA